jgi:hypothetical protein
MMEPTPKPAKSIAIQVRKAEGRRREDLTKVKAITRRRKTKPLPRLTSLALAWLSSLRTMG